MPGQWVVAALCRSGRLTPVRVAGYNRLVDHVGIHDQRRLTEALCKGSLVPCVSTACRVVAAPVGGVFLSRSVDPSR
ncbi:hypothetical protein Taro_016702 [Colocasia esculenta]|uniref:Uncharacterized protein n=1 Tax=Colocasia esculenta TaxID=4460 RepID=A0A843UP82_COLES|nr:hypothetical protein [Colocasia esculenta]